MVEASRSPKVMKRSAEESKSAEVEQVPVQLGFTALVQQFAELRLVATSNLCDVDAEHQNIRRATCRATYIHTKNCFAVFP